jgi:predicted dehydrogenase
MIGDFHAKAIEAMPEARLVAVLDVDRSRAEQFAHRHDCLATSEMDEFLATGGLEIVTVCTPSGMHLEPALAALESGRHVLVEKPLEVTLERCDRLIEKANQKNIMLGGIFQTRFGEGAQTLKRAAEEGRFGRLVLADVYVKWYRSQGYYDTGGWKGTVRYDGGGALMNQSIHAIDLLQWIAGPVSDVQAYTGTLGHERIEVEDTGVAALRFRNGALGVIEGSTASFPGSSKRLEISGTAGSAVLEEDALREWRFSEETEEDRMIRDSFGARGPRGAVSDPADIDYAGHVMQFRDVLAAMEGGRRPLIDGHEARKSVEIILAVYRSASQGRPVSLPLS